MMSFYINWFWLMSVLTCNQKRMSNWKGKDEMPEKIIIDINDKILTRALIK